jgi:hypothetical protein
LLIEKIVEHRDFFARLNGYDEYLLYDVNAELGEGKIGLLLLEPVGLLKSLVFHQETLKKLHEDTSIPPKKLRMDLSNGSIAISDARLIAKNIAGLRTEKKEKKKTNPRPKSARRAEPRREVMPQSLPEGFAPVRNRKASDTREVMERLRRDVENNAELATKTSEEILERLRSDVAARQKEAKTQ